MSLPQFQSNDRDFQLMQSGWAAQINPVLSNPLVNGNLLKNISLITGANVINTGLQRKLQGWFIVRQRASASIYDTQDSNQTPNLTLNLTTSANVIIDLYVF